MQPPIRIERRRRGISRPPAGHLSDRFCFYDTRCDK
jgi:hypothetical protein